MNPYDVLMVFVGFVLGIIVSIIIAYHSNKLADKALKRAVNTIVKELPKATATAVETNQKEKIGINILSLALNLITTEKAINFLKGINKKEKEQG
ncbi:hypothetical protein EHW67_09380 [Arenibacter aquaticus]|uniref:Uncharacterized protein n=1 Tax=Arenibacter aquaticus TaxID=2489054 RepID=A0A430K510_9FLAO|nr:hypothetical protein [Arenibacter aquaticus]RTE54124.1 hypothetical protein EHW67_09380 [Arenibacter aquaticus]